jgi:hypothetical protein
MANENLIKSEYEMIKGNFLEGIRKKILFLYQNVDKCEQECKSECESNYIRNRLNRKPEVESGAPPSIQPTAPDNRNKQGSTSSSEGSTSFSTSDSSPGFFGRIMQKYLPNDKMTTSDNSDSTSESGSVFSFVKSKIDDYKDQQTIDKAEQFCDKNFKTFDNVVHTQICSMPNRISSESTQGICKLAIKLRAEIDELFKLYKADIASNAAKIAEQKAEFLRAVGRKVGGSKKTQKRRKFAKKR